MLLLDLAWFSFNVVLVDSIFLRFDNKIVTFEEHRKNEHNLYHYLYFIVWLQIKDETEFTGPESYVANCIKVSNCLEVKLQI